MILTCPECASRYVLDDARLGPGGRTVRCAACGASWRAERKDAVAEPPVELSAPVPPPEMPAAAVERPAAALPKTFRAKTQARRRTRQAAVAGVVWGVLGALVLAVLIGAALFRVEVVRLWPRTAGAYAKVGLTVNPTGLAPENVLATPGLRDGHAAVIVTGAIRNVETRAHPVRPIRIALLDKGGHKLTSQVLTPAYAVLQPGQTKPFNVAFLDPPSNSTDVQVEFAFDVAAPQPPKPAPPRNTAPAAARPEPLAKPINNAQPAKPLPSGSPFALPAAADANTRPSPHDG